MMLGGTLNFCTLAVVSASEQCRVPNRVGRKLANFQGDSLEMHFQQNPVALLCVVTSMKLDEFITGSELFILLLHFHQFPLRNAALYDINFD